MRELSVEEKARRYDEVFKRANELNYVSDKDSLQRKTVEYIFPELKESENIDERVRKALIKLVTNHASMDLFIEYDIHLDEALSWLEKQQKTAWSKEDETMLNCCLGAVNTTDYFDKDNKDKMKNWLYNRFKSLKPQNRWNDISVPPKFPCDILFKYPNGNKFIFHYLENGRKNSAETPIFSSLEEGEWIYLDDIEPQSHWKPSDKQMEVMSYLAKYYAVSIDEPNRSIIISLYEDLQKLMKK